MSFSKRNQKKNELELGSDLVLTQEDFSAMRSHSSQDNLDLEAYLDFLEDIRAFESGNPRTGYFEDEFIL